MALLVALNTVEAIRGTVAATDGVTAGEAFASWLPQPEIRIINIHIRLNLHSVAGY